MDRVSTPQSMVASRTRTPAGVGRGRGSCGQGRVDADRGRGLFAHAEGACGFEVEVGRACIEKFIVSISVDGAIFSWGKLMESLVA